jgi:hypothetical protein
MRGREIHTTIERRTKFPLERQVYVRSHSLEESRKPGKHERRFMRTMSSKNIKFSEKRVSEGMKRNAMRNGSRREGTTRTTKLHNGNTRRRNNAKEGKNQARQTT